MIEDSDKAILERSSQAQAAVLLSPAVSVEALAVAQRSTLLALGGATFLAMLPVTLIVPVLKEVLIDRFGASTFWTHSFMSINLVGAVLASPLIAALCDRGSRRSRTITLALVGDGVLLLAMSVAPTLPLLLALRAVEGAMHMLAISGLMALAADHSDATHRGRVMGLLGACLMIGTAAGTRLGGVIPHAWTLAAAGGIGLAAACFAGLFVRDAGRHLSTARATDALSLLRAQPGLLVPYAYTFIERFCAGLIISTFGLFLAAVHNLSPDARSKLLVTFLLPFALLTYPMGRLGDRLGQATLLTIGGLGFGIVFALYGFVSATWLAVLMLCSGILSAMMFAPTLALCAQFSPGARRGAGFAGFNAAGSLGFLFGPLAGGAICTLLAAQAGTLGAYRATFVIAGAVQFALALACLPFLLRLRAARSA